ncbi:MAG: HD domain-containing protein [Anaerolineales bacterium]
MARLQGKIVGQGGTPRQALQAAKGSRIKEVPQVEYMAPTKSLSLPPLVERVRAALPGQEIYLVGGAVRDLLLGRQLHDIDFAVKGQAIPLARKLANLLDADFYVLDKERDVARLLLEDETDKHVTMDFITLQGADIDADLAARDLTINAMAIDLRQSHALLDPMGGTADLAAKRVRACAPESFTADPVRILRAIRMAALFGMKIENNTRKHMRDAVKGLKDVSPERLRDEFFHLLLAPKLKTSLYALDLLGALEKFLPEVNPLKGLEQSAPHIFEAWEHTLNVLEALEKVLDVLSEDYSPDRVSDLQGGLIVISLGRYRHQLSQHVNSVAVPDRPRRALLMFAALTHDVGKALTRSIGEDGRIHFYEHEARGAELADSRAGALHLSNDERELLHKLISNHMRPMQLTLTGELPSRRAIYRFFRATDAAGVDICLLSLADMLGKYGAEVPEAELKKHLETLRVLLEAYYEEPHKSVSPPILLNGDELMRELELKPGPKVGELLDALSEAQAIGEVGDREQALQFARTLLKTSPR